METSDKEYAARLVRLAVGLLYLAHALLYWGMFGLQHYFIAGEILGGALLMLNLYSRAAAVGLFPIAIGGALVASGTLTGLTPSECGYLATCFAGQAFIAIGALTPFDREEPNDLVLGSWSTYNSN